MAEHTVKNLDDLVEVFALLWHGNPRLKIELDIGSGGSGLLLGRTLGASGRWIRFEHGLFREVWNRSPGNIRTVRGWARLAGDVLERNIVLQVTERVVARQQQYQEEARLRDLVPAHESLAETLRPDLDRARAGWLGLIESMNSEAGPRTVLSRRYDVESRAAKVVVLEDATQLLQGHEGQPAFTVARLVEFGTEQVMQHATSMAGSTDAAREWARLVQSLDVRLMLAKEVRQQQQHEAACVMCGSADGCDCVE
jgi:hypothetical protein